MSIFGLSSLDALISVLLIETAWWGDMFFINILPSSFQNFIYANDLKRKPDLFGVVFGLLAVSIFLAKFLLQGVLWYAFLRNEINKHGRLLKCWCWIGIFLDFIAILYVVCWKKFSPYFDFDPVRLLVNLFPYLIIRGGIWVLAVQLVSDLSHKDKHLFPVSFVDHFMDHLRTEATLHIFLTWELIWYATKTAGTILSPFFGGWSVLLPTPTPEIDSQLVRILYILAVFVSLLLLIGIHHHWKILMKLAIPFYIILNVFGYVLISFLDLDHDYRIYSKPLPNYALLTAKVVLPLCALVLKLSVVFGSLNLICKSEAGRGHERHEGSHEEMPLIHSRTH